MRVSIRKEKPADREGIFAVHAAAFETPAEARAVDAVRANADPLISLVAVADGLVVVTCSSLP